jgi:hypothetical protein
MEHHQPDDREHFERHPDIRGLAGPNRHRHPHIDESLSEMIDLFSEERDLADLSDVSPGAALAVTFLDNQGAEQTLTFTHRPQPDSHTPRWRLATTTPDGEPSEKLATIHGSGLPSTSMVRLHRITEGLGLVYATVNRIEVRSATDLPPGSLWRVLLGEMANPEDIPVKDRDAYIRRGLMAYGQDGTLLWIVPDTTEKITGPIVRVRIIPPEDDGPANG